MLSLTGTWRLHLKQIDLLREVMNKCLNQRQKETKWLKWSKMLYPLIFTNPAFWWFCSPNCSPPLAGGLMYSPAHGCSPSNTRAPWGQLLLPPPPTPPWSPTVSWLTYLTTMDGLQQHTHWVFSQMLLHVEDLSMIQLRQNISFDFP